MTCEVKEVKHEEKNLRVVGEMSTSIGKSINTLTQKFTKNIEKNDESCKAQKIKIKETTKQKTITQLKFKIKLKQ